MFVILLGRLKKVLRPLCFSEITEGRSMMRVECLDKDLTKSKYIGQCDVSLVDVMERRYVEGWFKLTNAHNGIMRDIIYICMY
jgi:hypothetical protein